MRGMRSLKQAVRCILAAYLLTATLVSQSVRSVATQRIEDSDSYSIYSILISKEGAPTRPAGSLPKHYLIAQHTETKVWQPPPIPGRKFRVFRFPDCISIPPDEHEEYESAISSFERKNRSAATLQRGFSLERPYFVLADSEVRNYHDWTHRGWSGANRVENVEPDPLFEGVFGLISFSSVGFSKGGKVALVYMVFDAGPWYGTWAVYAFEKRNGTWEQKSKGCISET
jgi:hypothetical protein